MQVVSLAGEKRTYDQSGGSAVVSAKGLKKARPRLAGINLVAPADSRFESDISPMKGIFSLKINNGILSLKDKMSNNKAVDLVKVQVKEVKIHGFSSFDIAAITILRKMIESMEAQCIKAKSMEAKTKPAGETPRLLINPHIRNLAIYLFQQLKSGIENGVQGSTDLTLLIRPDDRDGLDLYFKKVLIDNLVNASDPYSPNFRAGGPLQEMSLVEEFLTRFFNHRF